MRRAWLIFGAVQATGVAGTCVGLLLQDGIIWGLCSLFLLPGILVLIPVLPPGDPKIQWPIWTLYVIALAANTLLFSAIVCGIAIFRNLRPKRS